LANDCSTDSTHAVIEEILESHPKRHLIKYTNHVKNLGMNANFEFALKHCIGEYIAICEGDDYWIDTLKLQKQVDFLDTHQDFILCYTNTSVVNSEGSIVVEKDIDSQKDTFTHSDMPIFVPTLTRVFRNQHIKELSFKARIGGDTYLLVWQSRFGKIKFLDDVTTCYRVHEGGMWNSQDDFGKLQHLILTRLACFDIVKNDTLMRFYHQVFSLLIDVAKQGKSYKSLLINFFKSHMKQVFRISVKKHLIIIKLFTLFFIQMSNSNLKSYKIKKALSKL